MVGWVLGHGSFIWFYQQWQLCTVLHLNCSPGDSLLANPFRQDSTTVQQLLTNQFNYLPPALPLPPPPLPLHHLLLRHLCLRPTLVINIDSSPRSYNVVDSNDSLRFSTPILSRSFGIPESRIRAFRFAGYHSNSERIQSAIPLYS